MVFVATRLGEAFCTKSGLALENSAQLWAAALRLGLGGHDVWCVVYVCFCLFVEGFCLRIVLLCFVFVFWCSFFGGVVGCLLCWGVLVGGVLWCLRLMRLDIAQYRRTCLCPATLTPILNLCDSTLK